MVLNIDLAPTLLELAGLAPPDRMQGRSLVPVLESPSAPGRKAWLYEHFPVFPIPIPGITAIRTERYKYVEYQNDLRPKDQPAGNAGGGSAGGTVKAGNGAA
jgi:arylsulfatase A-like enzyme